MLNKSQRAGMFVLALLAAEAHAGWLFESRESVWESHRNDARQIALATLRDVHQLSQDEVERFYGTGLMSDRPAFAFRVEVHETLRGAEPKAPLEVPFAFLPIAEVPFRPRTNQQREAELEGHKAIVIVHQDGAAKRPVVHVWPVSSFDDDEEVQFWRKVTALWNTTKLQERRKALEAGCHDSLPQFQDYCCRRLANWAGSKPDQNAAEQLERLAAFPVIWKRFLDPVTSLEVLATCDEILGRMSPGWRTHPVRYDIVAKALQRHSQLAASPDDSQTDFQLFERELSALSQFPGKERETYRMLAEIVDTAPSRYRWYTLSHLASLYRPYPLEKNQQRLNQEIWDRLAAALAIPESAPFAARALYDIARDYAYVGSLPAHVSKVLAAPPEELPHAIAARIGSDFDRFRQKLPEIALAAPLVELRRKEGYTNLTVPTRSQIGKQVVFVASPGHTLRSDPVFGDAASSSSGGWHDPVWIEKPTDWPQGGKGLMVVTGTLAERHDVPVFKLGTDADVPFQPGLPVPAGYDEQEIRRRYVVVDVKWQLAGPPPAKQGEKR